MLVPASYVARVCNQSAANKQTMMGCVQTCSVRHRPPSDRPLGNHSAFLEIDDGDVALASHNVSHRDVQSFSRWLDGDTRGIAAGKFDAIHQFGRFRVNDINRRIICSVLAAAAEVFKHRSEEHTSEL